MNNPPVVFAIIATWVILTGIIHLPSIKIQDKWRMILSGIFMYLALTISLVISGETPVWLLFIASIWLIPVGMLASLLMIKLHQWVKNNLSSKK